MEFNTFSYPDDEIAQFCRNLNVKMCYNEDMADYLAVRGPGVRLRVPQKHIVSMTVPDLLEFIYRGIEVSRSNLSLLPKEEH